MSDYCEHGLRLVCGAGGQHLWDYAAAHDTRRLPDDPVLAALRRLVELEDAEVKTGAMPAAWRAEYRAALTTARRLLAG